MEISGAAQQPLARLITGTPSFCVKARNADEYEGIFACGTEQGRVLIANYSSFDQTLQTQTTPEMQNIIQSYYLNFPQSNFEKQDPKLIWPISDCQLHQNSVFDLIWTQEGCKIVTASGDQTGALLDVERQKVI